VTVENPAGRFRLLVFDWDGTLLDSISSIVDCTQRALQDLGLPAVPDKRIRDAIGLGLRETVERFAPGCDESLFRDIVSVYGHHWRETYCHRPRLFPGARETLEELRRRGYLMGLATAKGRKGLSRDLQATGLGEYFHATRTVDEAKSKPHPQMILDILGEIGADAGQALVIGDTTHDLEMARNAGTAAVAVCTGSHSRKVLEEAQPLACLESIAEFAAWLDGDGGTVGSDRQVAAAQSRK
jgi:phosphoglycolate phosphatase